VNQFSHANPPSDNKYNWKDVSNYGEPPDGTYTIVVSMGLFSNSDAQVYKFTNVTITGGDASVPFNEVVGSSVGSNGRLK